MSNVPESIFRLPISKIEPIILGKIDLGIVNEKMFKAEKCCYCGNSLRLNYEITKDHLIPKSRGGTNNSLNIKKCCPACNLAKGSKYPEEFLIDFALKYSTKKGTIRYKYSHIKSYKKTLKNILYIVQYVRGHGTKLFNTESDFDLYVYFRKDYNPILTSITKMKL